MAAHDGRIYRVLFSPHSKTGARPEIHNVPVDMSKLKSWFPEIELELFAQFGLSAIILQKPDGREIRIEMDGRHNRGGMYGPDVKRASKGSQHQ